MAEYIDREAAIKYAVGSLHGVSHIVAVDVAEALEDIPTADVVEVRHGRWIRGDNFYCYYTCTNCRSTMVNHKAPYRKVWKYCPNCGAKMDGKGDTK